MSKNIIQQNINRQIKGEIYDSLRNALVKPVGKGKKSWTDTFIEAMLKEAKENPAGALGQLISKQLLQDDIISSLDEQTEKLLARDQDFLRYRVLKQLFAEQRNVLLDDKIRRKCLCTSRRAGKTNTLARLLVYTCITPNSPCLYLAVKFDNAIKQCFDLCIEAAKEAELVIDSSSKNDGSITFNNGSSITFRGNSNKAEADKLRGNKYRLACVDEAAFQINMPYLINDILTPCLMDYADSVLVLASTPATVPHTYFQQAFDSKEYKNYYWTLCDNPWIPEPEEEIKRIADSKGLSLDSPFIMRELRGLWYFDTEAQVYKGYKTYTKIPENFIPTHVIQACDWGYNDYNAFITLAYDCNTKQGYVIKESKFNKATVSDILDRCVEQYQWSKEWFVRYNPHANLENCYCVCDTNEKAMVYELNVKHKIYAISAYKYDKDNAIATLADFCRTNIYVPKDGIMEDEFQQTIYKRDEQDNITNEIDDTVFHPDAADALLYASRQYAFDCHIEDPIKEKQPATSNYEIDDKGNIVGPRPFVPEAPIVGGDVEVIG